MSMCLLHKFLRFEMKPNETIRTERGIGKLVLFDIWIVIEPLLYPFRHNSGHGRAWAEAIYAYIRQGVWVSVKLA